MYSQQDIINSLPSHLRPFCALQDYQRYTARDQAVWRFLLHQLRDNLTHSAHATYLEGLERTGIQLDCIPRIEEMNARLSDMGWRAVVVDGFVPPAIFMEFQAHCVLVIAVDMRTIEHMLYTPAPDIVHESAGHAPFIVDVDYAEFLQRFGELGMHAVASKDDMAVYEAIRWLSIIKESPNSTADEIDKAEAQLQAAIEANSNPSEASLLSRLHWWTVEYGLVGSVDDYRIFGAGLLSSLGESQHCLNDNAVVKRPLTVDAISESYDITTQQPQLFVTKSCRHLSQVLEEFGRQMCVNRGGAESLTKAIDAETVNTAVTNAGVEISGCFSRVITDSVGNVTYINTVGPTQLAYKGRQLKGHGPDFHAAGFGSPVGRLQSMERCLSSYTVDELKAHDIEVNRSVRLEFLSGITVSGMLTKIHRQQQKNLLLTFEQCTVTDAAGDILFDPDWGIFDMAVGDSIPSVYGGSADQDAYPLYQAPSKSSTLAIEYDQTTLNLFELYQQVRHHREQGVADTAQIEAWVQTYKQLTSSEWLLGYELLELAQGVKGTDAIAMDLRGRLQSLAESGDEEQACLIDYALKRC
ncbi:MAG: aromatic amino acid hydroxylase [Cellvibrionaceae bacterium]